MSFREDNIFEWVDFDIFSMTKILITGASGCSGKGILHYLLSHGYTDLSGLVRKIPEDHFSDVEYIVGDITNKDALAKLFKEGQFESIWHIAGAVHPHTKKELFHKINVEGTQNVLEAAIESNAKSFLFTSSIAVYGKIEEVPISEEHRIKPLGNYAKSKVEAENIVKTLSEDVGIKGGIVRLPVVLGKDDRHFYPIVGKLVNANIFPMMGNPNHNFSIIHPDDINKVMKSAEQDDLEFRIFDKNGKLKWLSGNRKDQFGEVFSHSPRRLWSWSGACQTVYRISMASP